MNNTIQSVIIDKREPEWIRNLNFGDAPVASDIILDAGDLWVATTDNALLIIERKTVSDLLGSISDGRLFSQVARMKEFSPWNYIIICGALIWETSTGKIVTEYKTTGWDMSAVWGALLTVQELGCFVIFCANENDFGPCVERIAKRDREQVRIHPVRQPHVLSAGEAFLTALPGIGYDKARALLDHTENVACALSCLTRLGNNDIPGIGDGIKRGVRKALELDEGWELWPLPKKVNE